MRSAIRRDEYIGTLVNAYLAAGGEAVAVPAGTAYVDVGTLGGYREAMRLLADSAPRDGLDRAAPLAIRSEGGWDEPRQTSRSLREAARRARPVVPQYRPRRRA